MLEFHWSDHLKQQTLILHGKYQIYTKVMIINETNFIWFS